MISELYIRIKNLNETKILAQKVSKSLSIPFFICLSGDIGSGKTTFARFLINQFSKKKIKVLSPTFPIVQIYDLKTVNIWHYDLYRIEKKNEFFNLDFDFKKWKDISMPDFYEVGFDENYVAKEICKLKNQRGMSREHSIERFGLNNMLEGYMEVYKSVNSDR